MIADTDSLSILNPEKGSKLYRSHSSSTIDYKDSDTPESSRTSKVDGYGYQELFADQMFKNQEKGFNQTASLLDYSIFYNNQRKSITDRFIPMRKTISSETMFQDEENNQNQQKFLQVEPTHYQISDIYKKYVMLKPTNNLESEKKHIASFKTQNILKYSKNHQQSSTKKVVSQNFLPSTDHQQMYDELRKYKKKRIVSKVPLKVLDAPSLQNDYYLNVIDWSSDNIISVGLGANVYLWNGGNCRVTKLCDVGIVDTVCSVSWSLKDPILAVGSSNGQVKLWDVEKLKKVRSFSNHTNRVSTIAWNTNSFCSGSRDKLIYHCDPRIGESYQRKLAHHKQQICGLKWSPDQQQICSGGNDNKLLVWNNHSLQPVYKFNDHLAAVKAVAWSPYQHGLLVSGGGTADRTIKFRNTLTGQTVKSMNVGSQVCNLAYSKSLNQLISTHGYSQNQINIWRCPKMQKTATLTGHTLRVLYLSMSPDGSTIVTGAGDQTLRFWSVFPAVSKETPYQTKHSQLKIEGASLR